jgi:uncharacterized membrane protein
MSTTPEFEPQTSSTDAAKKPLVITAEQASLIHQKLQWGRYITWSSYIGMLLLFLFVNLTDDNRSLKFLFVQAIPLLIFIPGFLRETHRTYSWLCFVILMYFLFYVPLAMGRNLWSDWLATFLCCALFIAAMMTSRWLQYWNYYLATKPADIN